MLCLSLLVVVLDSTILNVALPTLIARTSTRRQPAPVDRRRLHDRVRRAAAHRREPRRPLRAQGRLQLGLVIFGVGSVASAFANSAEQLIATRAFMGIGAAFIMPATLSIITNVFPARGARQGDRHLGRPPASAARSGR